MTEWLIAIIISVAGLRFALMKSTWAVDYAVLVFVLNRSIRRLVDFYINGEFHPLSPISLTPLIVAGAMALPCIMSFGRLPRFARIIYLCLAGGVVYAFAIGFIQVQFAAVYSLAEVLAPIALGGYVMVANPSSAIRDRWVRSFSWGAIVASIYGWYQYLYIPPWDAFWLTEAGLVGYMGYPEPTKMSVFSTMAERGPLAGYLGFSVVPMIVSARWRTALGWPAVVLIFSAILLTMARAGLLVAVIGTVVYILVNRGAKAGQITVAIAVVGLAAWFGLERLPGSERIIERLQTLENIQEDGSYQGRVEIMSGGFRALALNPFGGGLGAAGLGTRVNTGGIDQTATVGDAGYFQIILVYGIVGTGLLIGALILSWKRLSLYFRLDALRNDHVLLARALMVAMIPACWAGDMLTGFSIFWLVLGCGLTVPKEVMARAVALLASHSLEEAQRDVPLGSGARGRATS